MPLRFGWSITAEYGTANHCPSSVGLCGSFNKTLYTLCRIPLDFRGLAIAGVTARLPRLILETLEPRVELWSHRVMRIGFADPEKRNRTQSHHASYDQPIRTRRPASLRMVMEPSGPPNLLVWVIGTARRFNRHFRIWPWRPALTMSVSRGSRKWWTDDQIDANDPTRSSISDVLRKLYDPLPRCGLCRERKGRGSSRVQVLR